MTKKRERISRVMPPLPPSPWHQNQGLPRSCQRILCLLVIALFCSTSIAFAQNTSPEGDNGLKIGSGRLHPFVEADTHYIYNPHRIPREAETALEDTAGSVFGVRPGADYILPSAFTEIELQALADLRYFSNSHLPDNLLIGSDTRLSVLFNKESTLPIKITTRFLRTDKPANQVTTVSLMSNAFHFDVHGKWKPGGGAFTLDFRAPVVQTSYDAKSTTRYDRLNNLNMRPAVRLSWKLLPKTALILDAVSNLIRYSDHTYSTDIDFVTGYLGLAGAITPRVSTLIKAGWTEPLYATQFMKETKGFVGQFTLGYKISDTLDVTLGGGQEVKPTPLFNYHKDVYTNLGVLLRMGTGITLDFDFEARTLDYGTPSVDPGDLIFGLDERNDTFIKPSLVISYLATRWLTVSLHNSYEFRDTGAFRINIDNRMVTGGYNYFDSFLRLSFRY